MKLSQRFLSVLLVCALLSAVFSVSASAEDIEIKDTMISIRTMAFQANSAPDVNDFIVYLNDGEIQRTTYTYNSGIPNGQKMFTLQQMLTVQYENGEPLLKKDRQGKITLLNAYLSVYFSNTDNKYSKYDRDLEQVRLLVYYIDGTSEYIDEVTIDKLNNNGVFNFTAEFKPKNDVSKVEFVITNNHVLTTTYTTDTKVEIHIGEVDSPNLALSISIQSEEAGLLSSVVQWLKGIKEGISSLFNTLKELPSVLWSYIQNGLQRLFVPTEDFLVTFKEEMNTMLESKLGAVYEVVSITFESWETIRQYDSVDTIELPEVTLPLLGNDSWTFGGYDIRIVPEGFEFMATACKTVIGILCTAWFVNGLRRRYDEIMGVE